MLLKLKDGKKDKVQRHFLVALMNNFFIYLGAPPTEDAQLDHICPLAQAQDEEELYKLCHYSNIKWLGSKANSSKGDSWTPEGAAMCLRLLGREWLTDEVS